MKPDVNAKREIYEKKAFDNDLQPTKNFNYQNTYGCICSNAGFKIIFLNGQNAVLEFDFPIGEINSKLEASKLEPVKSIFFINYLGSKKEEGCEFVRIVNNNHDKKQPECFFALQVFNELTQFSNRSLNYVNCFKNSPPCSYLDISIRDLPDKNIAITIHQPCDYAYFCDKILPSIKVDGYEGVYLRSNSYFTSFNYKELLFDLFFKRGVYPNVYFISSKIENAINTIDARHYCRACGAIVLLLRWKKKKQVPVDLIKMIHKCLI